MLSFQTVKTKLFAPVDAITSSIFLRLFGFIIVLEAYGFAQYDFIEQGILAPKFLFGFDGFSFIKPLPAGLMKGMLLLILVSGILLIVQKFIKFALISFLICFSYFFLLDKSYYNNHFYLLILIGFIFLFYKEKTDLIKHKKQIPYWFLLLLQIQIVIVYFYGGIAKLNTDWLLHQQPLQILLDGTKQNALLPDLNTSAFALYLLTYGGLLFDLSIGFLLWIKKTRKLGIILSLGFNLSNIVLFNFGDNGAIGGFPIFMIFSLLLFIDPKSVRNYLDQWGLNDKTQNAATTAATTAKLFDKRQNLVLVGLGIYLSFQLLFPFRQFLYPGNTSWTARGSKFSWRMKVHTKIPDIRFFGRPSPKDSLREINVGKMINSMQRYQMGEDPVMIVQFAHFIGKEFKDNGASQPEVYAHARISLNGRPYFAIVDSTRDLLKVEHHIIAADDWIRPLTQSELQQIK